MKHAEWRRARTGPPRGGLPTSIAQCSSPPWRKRCTLESPQAASGTRLEAMRSSLGAASNPATSSPSGIPDSPSGSPDPFPASATSAAGRSRACLPERDRGPSPRRRTRSRRVMNGPFMGESRSRDGSATAWNQRAPECRGERDARDVPVVGAGHQGSRPAGGDGQMNRMPRLRGGPEPRADAVAHGSRQAAT